MPGSVYPWACADPTDGKDELVQGGFVPQIYTLDMVRCLQRDTYLACYPCL